jgi:hypothetical protein
MGTKKPWVRGAVTLAVIGGLAAALMASPVGAALSKSKVKKIANKVAGNVANEVFDAEISNYYTKSEINQTVYRYEQSIPSGVTVTGVFGGLEYNDGTSSTGSFYNSSVSLPAPAPVALTDANVNFSNADAALAGDEDVACTGTVAAPTAPSGKVCLYISNTASVAANTADGTALPGSGGSRFGFAFNATGSGASAEIYGVWAYTAP